jgi:hypothetical protein
MNAVDLEQLIDRELKQLPTPPAPRTLLPRVLAATVHRKPAPWYARPWVTWPRGWQIASVVVFVAIGVSLSIFMPTVQHVAGNIPSRFAGSAPGRIAAVAAIVAEGATLVRVFWQVMLEPVAFYLLILAVSLSLACAAVWTALERVALGGASQQ